MKTSTLFLLMLAYYHASAVFNRGSLTIFRNASCQVMSAEGISTGVKLTSKHYFPYNTLKKSQYGFYVENNFRALAVHISTVNRATFALGSTYQARFCYNNADKSKKDIYRVLSIDNDLMLEGLLSDKNHVNMGLLISSTWNYRVHGIMNYPMIGVQLRTSIQDSYAIMPVIGFTNLIRDVYYGYTTYATGIYANYSKHNIGFSFRLSELLEAFNQK